MFYNQADMIPSILLARRSIRRFKPDPVPEAVIERLLTAATFAPSAHNLQPWRFVVIRSPQAKIHLGEALTAQMRLDMRTAGSTEAEIDDRVQRSMRRLREAPVVILLCRDKTAVNMDAPEETIMGIQSVAMAGLQILLAAHAEGLGANWICWPLYAQQATRLALSLPDTWEPEGMIFVGYPAEEPKEKHLRPLNEMVIFR